MGGQESEKGKRNICVGLLAHVDAGKTTLAESILYLCGGIRTPGRVDHGNAFLDHFAMERARGITIFAKQAQISLREREMTLLDTPGHVDFSAEMERTLQVLDYAVLVVSGADGVQGHTETLWRLLKRYGIPVFLFVNKMDQEGTDRERLLCELKERLDERCILFGPEAEKDHREQFLDEAAMCGETLLEEYLETGELSVQSLAEAIEERLIFPCYFGSALRISGVEELLGGIERYTLPPKYPEEFGARVYKIGRDAGGNRLTYLKITGGSLRVKGLVDNKNSSAKESELWEEKADQLRIYSGGKYRTAEEVFAGEICAVTGLTKTFAGQGLGYERENEAPVLEPVLTYQILLPESCDPALTFERFRVLEEEDPLLHLVWKAKSREIHVQVMGEVQIEVLKGLIRERFGLTVSFGPGSIVYKETVAAPVVGIGHFEPLRHYAEVHLLLEPGERGSGLQFASCCSEDILDRNWQRLILSQLEERVHPGVLTGSELTDMRIVLIAGKAHLKHTEGGDFRQAACRALRQGLRMGKSILLEPVFSFTLELPAEALGHAMADIQRMYGCFDPPEIKGDRCILKGSAPVACMGDYQREVNAYTGGRGRLSCMVKGYEPCHNAEETIAAMQYNPEADTENPSSSVFCAHGAGYLVPWDQVEEYAHVENGWKPDTEEESAELFHTGFAGAGAEGGNPIRNRSSAGTGYITQEEIDAIFLKTYGRKSVENNRYRRYHREGVQDRQRNADGNHFRPKPQEKKEEYLLVDGYNIIFAWEELRGLAARNMDSARDRLMDIMSSYQGCTGCTLILVFDAYRVRGNPGKVWKYHNIHVVFTREAETADQYIEKAVHHIGKQYHVTVATSDALEQMIIWGEGAMRLSATGLRQAVEAAAEALRRQYDITQSP